MSASLLHPERSLTTKRAENKNGNTDLESIKEWLRKQPHLPDSLDETIILHVLKFYDNSLEKCKIKIDQYCTMKTALPEFFCDRDVFKPEMREIRKFVEPIVLPELLDDNKNVYIIRVAAKDFNSFKFDDYAKLITIMSDLKMILEPANSIGDVYIVDYCKEFYKFFIHISLVKLKKLVMGYQAAYTLKIKEIHLMNASPITNIFLNLTKPFLKEKIRNRIHLHTDLESLYNFIPKRMLPRDYGGPLDTIDVLAENGWKIMELHSTWLMEQEAVKVNESKRPGRPKNYDDLFGIDGSFRQLSID